MKVAFCIRPEYNNPLGGDAVQMLKTKEYLEKNHSITIDIITSPINIDNSYNIIHVFNFSTYNISKEFFKKALELKIPIVASSIFWDYSYASTTKLFYFFPFLNHLDEITIAVFRKIIKIVGYLLGKPTVLSFAFKQNSKWMYKHSTIVSPNSIEEAILLLKWINVSTSDKIRVVYNATEQTNEQSILNKDTFHKKYNIPKDYILQVGRIEYCKNQLNVISALKDNPEIPIVFVGKIVDDKYFKKIITIAHKRGNIYFIDAVPHNEINSFFRYARLHVLLSLRESPGLVNIEALSNGCPIVISDERFLPVKTYFEKQPYIVNPLNIKDIKITLLDAYHNPKKVPFDFNKFSWDTASNQTANIYNEILRTNE